MGSTRKKTSVSKGASRPLKNVGLRDATMAASTGSTYAGKNGSNGRITKARSKKSSYISPYLNTKDVDGEDDDEFSNMWSKPKSTNGSDSDSEIESTTEDSDDDYAFGSNVKSKGNINLKCKSKNDGLDPNGRVKGRDLIPWTRPRMIEKLILHLQYEAELAGIKLPWDAAVKRLHPGSKEGAAVQQLSKLRGILLTEGHMVPPKAKVKNKKGFEHNPQIRGYIRPDVSGPYDTRVVGWGEKIVDLSKNIENPGIYRGSGKYPRLKKGSAQSTAGAGQNEHRSRSDSPTDPKLSRMVTLKLPPKHLAKFPPGTARDRGTKDEQNTKFHKYGDQAAHHAEVETDVTAHSGFEGYGKEPDSDNYSMTNQNACLGAIKSEYLDDQGSYKDVDRTVAEVNDCNANGALNCLTGGLSISETMHPHATQNDPNGNETMASFESAVGDPASPIQSGMFSGINSTTSGPGGYQHMYALGNLDQYNRYCGPFLVGNASYAPHQTMSMGLANGGQHNQDTGISNQIYASFPCYPGSIMGDASDAGTGLTSTGLSYGAVTLGGYDHIGAADLKNMSSSKGDNSAVATDHAATGLYSSQQPPIYSPVNQTLTSNFGHNCSGGEESYDVGDYLNDDIFESTN